MSGWWHPNRLNQNSHSSRSGQKVDYFSWAKVVEAKEHDDQEKKIWTFWKLTTANYNYSSLGKSHGMRSYSPLLQAERSFWIASMVTAPPLVTVAAKNGTWHQSRHDLGDELRHQEVRWFMLHIYGLPKESCLVFHYWIASRFLPFKCTTF